jgi:hypothetical protein
MTEVSVPGFNPDDFYSVMHVMHELGCSESWVRILQRKGILDYVDTDLGYLFTRASVEKVRAARAGKPMRATRRRR